MEDLQRKTWSLLLYHANKFGAVKLSSNINLDSDKAGWEAGMIENHRTKQFFCRDFLIPMSYGKFTESTLPHNDIND